MEIQKRELSPLLSRAFDPAPLVPKNVPLPQARGQRPALSQAASGLLALYVPPASPPAPSPRDGGDLGGLQPGLPDLLEYLEIILPSCRQPVLPSL